METSLVKSGRHTRTLLRRHYEQYGHTQVMNKSFFEDHFLKGVGKLATKAFKGIENKVVAKTVAKANAKNGTNIDVKKVQSDVQKATEDRGINKQIANAAKAVVLTAAAGGLGSVLAAPAAIGGAAAGGAGAGGTAGGAGALGLGSTVLSTIKKPDTKALTDQVFVDGGGQLKLPKEIEQSIVDSKVGQSIQNIADALPPEIKAQVNKGVKSAVSKGKSLGKTAISDIITNGRTNPELLPKTRAQKDIENALLKSASTNNTTQAGFSVNNTTMFVIGGVITLIVLAMIFRNN